MLSDRRQFSFWGMEVSQKLYCRSCGNFILVPPEHEKFRQVDFGEIFWAISGRCFFFYEDKEWILRPGQVWYYPPGSFHQYRPIDRFHYCWLTIAGENAEAFFRILNVKPGLNSAGDCPQQLFTLLSNDLSVYSAQHRVGALNTAFRIVTQITMCQSEGSQAELSMTEAKNFIDTNFDDPEMSVNRLAENMQIHRGSLSRAFRRVFHTTVADYLGSVRFRNSINLLKDSELSIKEIAVACGFTSANYFSKFFTAKSGMTPQRYRSIFQSAAVKEFEKKKRKKRKKESS